MKEQFALLILLALSGGNWSGLKRFATKGLKCFTNVKYTQKKKASHKHFYIRIKMFMTRRPRATDMFAYNLQPKSSKSCQSLKTGHSRPLFVTFPIPLTVT